MRLPLALLILATGTVCAQPTTVSRTLVDVPWCEEADAAVHRWRTSRGVACEVREFVIQTDELDVAGLVNGGVTVKEWGRDDVLVRARVVGTARTASEAARLVHATRVNASGGRVRAETPSSRNNATAWVDFEIFAPRSTDLSADVVNGPLTISGLSSEISAEATNGPVTLENVGGDVSVKAMNGPVTVSLDGDRWRGSGLHVETANGPITLVVSDDFSARVEVETRNGHVHCDDLGLSKADRQRGRRTGDSLAGTIGNGGPPLRFETANGPVFLRTRG